MALQLILGFLEYYDMKQTLSVLLPEVSLSDSMVGKPHPYRQTSRSSETHFFHEEGLTIPSKTLHQLHRVGSSL